MQPPLVEAYVLHRRPYRETSFLVDCLTEEHGLVRCVARGQRSKKTGGGSVLQSFRPLQMAFAGRSDLKQLRSLEALGRPWGISGKRLFAAMYLNEMLVRILQRDLPVPELYHGYVEALVALSKECRAMEPILRQYELLILASLGVSPDFEHHDQGAIEAHQWYRFELDHGFVFMSDCTGGPYDFNGSDILAIAAQQWHANSLKAAKRLTRLALKPLLGDKPLKSRELFLSLES